MFAVEVPFTYVEQTGDLAFLSEHRVPDDYPHWACLHVQVGAIETTPPEESLGCRRGVIGEINHIEMETLGIDHERTSLSGADFDTAKIYLERWCRELIEEEEDKLARSMI